MSGMQSAPDMPCILAVVLHYGQPSLTQVVHEDLLRQASGQEAANILVLDNGAPQPYAGALRLDQNLFWGGGLAHALALGQQRGADYVWFCNNDLTFVSQPPLLRKVALRVARLHKVLGHEVGIWAPAVTRSPYLPQMVHAPQVQYRLARCVDGIAPLISLACVRALGGVEALGFAENPRGYGLDIWLSWQAHAAGWPVVVDQQVVVRHRYHSTARTVQGFLPRAARDEHNFMSARLGPAWRERVRQQASVWEDMTEL